MKRGGMGDVGSLVERTGEWEQRQIARCVAALDPIVLRLDVNSASEVIIQQESNEAPRSEVLRGLPFISLLGQQLLKIFSTAGTWRQCFDVRLDCELCFAAFIAFIARYIYMAVKAANEGSDER